MPKNIVVFSDGTGQDGGRNGSNTNVYKLFNMIEDRTDNQIAFYDRGLGTGWRRISGLVAGAGISENILECYQFIFENYEAGDSIYLFGFSRGATTVRSLSSFIHIFGMLPKSRPELIQDAYNIYQINNIVRRDRQAKEFVDLHHTMWCRVRFMGVWDTVAALGIPVRSIDVALGAFPWFRHDYQDLRLSACVEQARHALAIDEERAAFLPMIWDKETSDYQTIKQVWFGGMHSDVGGGYAEQELSDIPLIWLIEEAKALDLRIFPRHQIKVNPDPNGVMHNSRGEGLSKLYKRGVRSWDSSERGAPTVHESVLLRSNDKNNAYRPWILEMEHEVEPWPEHLRKSGRLLQNGII